jgi:uncharacterized damage-inducible protein DinB
MTTSQVFLDYSARKLEQLGARIETCLLQLKEEQIWWRAAENQNAVGNLVLHLAGNVRQWIGHGVAGWPDLRQRDLEFAARNATAAELAQALKSSLEPAIEVLRSLDPAELDQPLGVQGYQVTKLEGIYHVVEHFSQHTGQIILLTKALTGSDLGFYAHIGRPAHKETTP